MRLSEISLPSIARGGGAVGDDESRMPTRMPPPARVARLSRTRQSTRSRRGASAGVFWSTVHSIPPPPPPAAPYPLCRIVDPVTETTSHPWQKNPVSPLSAIRLSVIVATFSPCPVVERP